MWPNKSFDVLFIYLFIFFLYLFWSLLPFALKYMFDTRDFVFNWKYVFLTILYLLFTTGIWNSVSFFLLFLSFVRPFVRPCVRPSVRPFVRSFVRSFARSFFLFSFFLSFFHSFFCSFFHTHFPMGIDKWVLSYYLVNLEIFWMHKFSQEMFSKAILHETEKQEGIWQYC